MTKEYSIKYNYVPKVGYDRDIFSKEGVLKDNLFNAARIFELISSDEWKESSGSMWLSDEDERECFDVEFNGKSYKMFLYWSGEVYPIFFPQMNFIGIFLLE